MSSVVCLHHAGPWRSNVCFSTDHFADFIILHAQSSCFVSAYPFNFGILGRTPNLKFVAVCSDMTAIWD